MFGIFYGSKHGLILFKYDEISYLLGILKFVLVCLRFTVRVN